MFSVYYLFLGSLCMRAVRLQVGLWQMASIGDLYRILPIETWNPYILHLYTLNAATNAEIIFELGYLTKNEKNDKTLMYVKI